MQVNHTHSDSRGVREKERIYIKMDKLGVEAHVCNSRRLRQPGV